MIHANYASIKANKSLSQQNVIIVSVKNVLNN